MSERQINDPQPTPESPASVGSAAEQLASARRRRFIKMGAGAVPVGLTVASRPVLATNCMSASAWGSVQGLAGTSQYARKKQTTIGGTFTLNEWKDGTKICNGWSTAGITNRTTYQVGTLCGTAIPAGLYSNSRVWTVLTGTSATDEAKFQRAMIVAWLNYKVSASVRDCVTDTTRPTANQLATLGAITKLGGKGPDGKDWTQAGVVKYLSSNFISL